MIMTIIMIIYHSYFSGLFLYYQFLASIFILISFRFAYSFPTFTVILPVLFSYFYSYSSCTLFLLLLLFFLCSYSSSYISFLVLYSSLFFPHLPCYFLFLFGLTFPILFSLTFSSFLLFLPNPTKFPFLPISPKFHIFVSPICCS